MKFSRKLYYILNSGKNSKLRYYLTSYFWIATPHRILSLFRKATLSKVEQRKDWAEIKRRVNYYNRLERSAIDSSHFQSKAMNKRKPSNRCIILTHTDTQKPFR